MVVKPDGKAMEATPQPVGASSGTPTLTSRPFASSVAPPANTVTFVGRVSAPVANRDVAEPLGRSVPPLKFTKPSFWLASV